MRYLSTLFLLFTFLQTNAQYDTLLLLSGRKVPGKIKKIGDKIIQMNVLIKGELKPAEIDRNRVFSVTYVENKTQILYEQDTVRGHDYTVKEMQRLIYGEQDAQNNHSMLIPFIVGTGLGAAGGYYTNGDFSVVAVPFFAMLTTALITPQGIRKKAVRDQKYRHDKPYKTGYRRVRKSKKSKNIIWGSVIGTVTGVIVGIVSK